VRRRAELVALIALSFVPLLATLGIIWFLCWLAGLTSLAYGLAAVYLVGDGYIRIMTRQNRLRYAGVRMSPKAEPALYELIERTLDRVHAPALDGVWLEHGANAGALVGRRDWLLRRHVGLVLGFLTVIRLDAAALEAVLAHEAGHLTDSDSLRRSLAARRYRGRRRLAARTSMATRWYWKWWLRLSREQAIDAERHADAVAIELTSREIAGEALGETVLADAIHRWALYRLHEYWQQGVAPSRMRPLYEMAWDGLSEEAARRLLDQRVAQPDAPEDTHPGLAERYTALLADLKSRPLAAGLLHHVDHFDRACTALYTRHTSRHNLEAVELKRNAPSEQT